MVKKFRRGFIFKKDILDINGEQAIIETDKHIYSVRFENSRFEFFKIRGSFPAKYYIGDNKYCFKRPFSIKYIESKDVLYKIAWKRPYYIIMDGDVEVAKFMINTRNYGDVSLACTNPKYDRISSELALAISLKKVEHQTFINIVWFLFSMYIIIVNFII